MKLKLLISLLLPIGLMRFNLTPEEEAAAATAEVEKNKKPKIDPDQKFSAEYVHELREENKAWRLKHQTAEGESAAHKTAAEKAKIDSDEAIKVANTAANERILRSELKAHAIKAGIVDLDALKLVDMTKVKLLDDGTVEGADALFEELKKSKPYLFATTTSTSSTEKKPDPKPGEPKNVKEMTDEEYALERKKIK
jgi:hypothetical protein